jgi:DNA-binding transcriptional MerR regulator
MIKSLQENSVQLLIRLYTDKRLELTKAMLSIQNNYYPSIEEILQTLELYKEIDLVKEFTKSNKAEIENATKSILSKSESASLPEPESHSEEDSGGNFMDFFADKDAFGKLKEVSLSSLEGVISEGISKITNSALEVSVTSLKANKISFGMSAKLHITVSSK